MPTPNFYSTLGVSESSSQDEIKKAYRKLAKKYHPDVTGGDKTKEAKFKEITEAYETLSEPKKRSEYDAMRKNPYAGGAGFGRAQGFEGFPGFEGFRSRGTTTGRGSRASSRVNIDLGDIFGNEAFSDLFGGSSSGFERAAPSSAKGNDVQASVDLTLPEAALGVEKSLVLEPQAAGGRKITIRVPAGVESGETIRVKGQGRPSPRGGQAGDLLLTVRVMPHAHFKRHGADIETDLHISIVDAILGTKTEVETLEGKVQVTVPAETSSGQKLRLRGKGASDRKGGRGDFYAVVQIDVPKQISKEAQELIKQFGALVESGRVS